MQFQKEIENLNLKLKPYTEERSNIMKNINILFVKIKETRFLKEPKGVMPTVLEKLLDARQNTQEFKLNNSKNILKIKNLLKTLKVY